VSSAGHGGGCHLLLRSSAAVNARPLRFALTFVLAFTLLASAFEASRGSAFERFVVETLILKPTTALIDVVTPHEDVQLVGRTLVSPDGSRLHVTRGCEGIEMFLLLIAAIVAFPAPLARRVRGLLVGSVLAYGLSVARLMVLHYVLRYSPTLWESLHGLILPLGPVVLLALYFLRWAASAATPNVPRTAAHAS
jgi:exosortase family protein XrtM